MGGWVAGGLGVWASGGGREVEKLSNENTNIRVFTGSPNYLQFQ